MVWVSVTNPFAVITLHADRQQLFVERNEVASARSALNVVKTPWVRAGVDRGGHPNNDDTVTGRSALLGGPNVLKARTAAAVDSTDQAYQNF